MLPTPSRALLLRLALLALCLGLWVAMCAWLFAGLWDPDDYLYARYANDWRIGVVALRDWYAPRLALTLPVAASFAAFGASDLSACAWPLLAATGTLVALFGITRRLHGETTAWLAALLLATSPGFAFRAGALRPDAVLCLGLFGAIAAWLEAGACASGARRRAWWIACAALAFVAHLAREVALPLLALFWCVELASTCRLRRDTLTVAALLLGLLAAEAFWLARATGDPLFRFHVLADYAKSKSYALRFGFYVAPLLQDWMRAREPLSLAWLSLPALGLVAACVVARRVPVLLLAWLVVWWLALELAPSQLVPYRPAFKEARYALPLLPLLAALTAFALASLASARSRLDIPWLARGVAGACLVALVLGGLALAWRPPPQRVEDAFVTDARWLSQEQQPYREVAERIHAGARRVYVPDGLEGARLARAVAFYLGYPDDGSRDPSALVPGCDFHPIRRGGARPEPPGFVVHWTTAAWRRPGRREVYRSERFVLYELASRPGL